MLARWGYTFVQLFSVGSLGLLWGQQGDSCSHSGILAGLAVAGRLLGPSFLGGLLCRLVLSHYVCRVCCTPGGTLLTSWKDSEGASYLQGKRLIPRLIFSAWTMSMYIQIV